MNSATKARQLLLAEPALTVEDIAGRVGFSSASHLASAFRRQTRVSPKAFRAFFRG
jgi:AraC-like DNA-binding protein